MSRLTLASHDYFTPFASANTVRPMPSTIYSLQAARAVAAILVVLFHTNVAIFGVQKYWGAKPFGRLFDFGNSGVMIFFVLSGFIILQVHHAELGRPERIRTYLWKRFRRIYPIYWLVMLATLPIYFLVPTSGYGFETRPDVLLSSLLLVHFTAKTNLLVVSVAWTLCHEILFYAIFTVMMWRVRLGLVAMTFWFCGCIATLLFVKPVLDTGFYYSQLNLLFGFGMAASWWMRRRAIPLPLAWLATGAAIFLLAGVHQIYRGGADLEVRSVVYGAAATMMLVGIVELERQARLTVPSWLKSLGDASYAIYLVHFLVLSMLAKVMWASGLARVIPAPLAFLGLVAGAIGAGVLCHRCVERPLLGLLKRRPNHRLALAGSRA